MSPAPRRLRQLAGIDVGELRHVGPQRRAAFSEFGVETVFDLLTTYPRRYIDRTRRVDLSDLAVGEEVAVFGTVESARPRRTRRNRSLVEVVVADGLDAITVVFFNQPWRHRQLAPGTQTLLFGKVTDYRGRRQMANPFVDVLVGVDDPVTASERAMRVVPIYPASGKAGLTSWEIGGSVEEALGRAGELVDPVPAPIRRRLDLVDRTAALRNIHLPERLHADRAARRRLAFDELLRLQLLLVLRRRRLEAGAAGMAHPAHRADLATPPGTLGSSSLVARFLAGHRYALTPAQGRVLAEIFDDLAGPAPMHRLLQGDVGAGKTLVALTALLAVVDGGRQGAVMAPTEVLAEQHFAVLREDLAGLTRADPATLAGERPVVVRLLTGSVGARARRAALAGLASGEVDIAVGTHALLGADVTFGALGLVVIDEQHRFGVEQRATLAAKGRARTGTGADPDVLVMTATPIPRTAALVLFSDLDLSTLDELPAGRAPVATTWLRGDAGAAWAAVRAAARSGNRSFVVCPLVEGSEKLAVASAVRERDALSAGPLAGLRLGLLHGQMRPSEKDAVMAAFRAGALDVLVATVVIEVGVDVPEATVMVIEDAWRFGLAQLHQLRGRVGRGADPGTCFVLGEPPSPDGAARLTAIETIHDGFVLAEKDLELRGEGTLLGARQRGRSDLVLARLATDQDLLAAAREAAIEIVDADPDLADHAELVDELRLFVDDDEATYLFKS